MGGMMRMMMGGMGGPAVGGPGLGGPGVTPTPPRRGVPPSGFAIGGSAGIPAAPGPKPMSGMIGDAFKERLMRRPGLRLGNAMTTEDKIKNALMMLVRGG